MTPAPALVVPPSSARVHVLEVLGNGIVGGMESCAAALVERLPRRRFAVTVLLPYECALAERLRLAGAAVEIVSMPEDPLWSSIQAVCALVRQGRIDVLHAHLPNAHVLAALVGAVCDRPVLATVHGRQLLATDLEVHRATASHLALVCRHSHLQALGMDVDARLLSCIPNGIDTDRFRPQPRGDHALRRRHGIADDAPVVGFVGRLSPEKGPDVLLRAVLLLKTLRPDARCIVCGDGPMREALATFVERYALGDTVHFAGVCEDMPAAYAAFDVLLSSSHSEALPLALMEAMACAVPVVATRVGGVPELVVHGQTGWLAAPRDFDGMAQSVARLFGDPGERARMGAAGRERVCRHFEIETSVDATAALLAALAQRRLGTPARAGARNA
jgi:glycosyltransferase involved in cell wall biosynthesis